MFSEVRVLPEMFSKAGVPPEDVLCPRESVMGGLP